LLWNVGLARAETQTSPSEQACLERHAGGLRRLVEVGTWHGVNTARLRRVMAPDGILWAVDPYARGRLGFSMQRVIARREVARVSNGEVVWVRTTGKDAARRWAAEANPPVEFLFVDGDHSYEGLRGDWEGWSGLVALGGLVALHDSRPTPTRNIEGSGSVVFTRDVILRDARIEVADVAESLTVLRRRADLP
jgi:predicted O-methyltransferase YrrM